MKTVNNELEKYLHRTPKTAYWINNEGKKYCQSVHGRSFIRYNEAKKQAERDVVDKETIINYQQIQDLKYTKGVK